MAKVENSEQQNCYFGREYYIELFRKNNENIKRNQGKNISIIGHKYTGKTTILKNYVADCSETDLLAVYINLEKFSLTPESFAISYVGNICFSYGNEPYSAYKDYMDISFILAIKNKFGKKAAETIEAIYNELQKVKPNQQLLVELALGFSDKLGKKSVICIDEFWKIKDLDNFNSIKDVLSVFKKVSSGNSNTNYVISGSAVIDTKILTTDLGFILEEINGVDRASCAEIVNSMVSANDATIDKIFHLSNGIPYYIRAICLRMKKYGVNGAFVLDTLSNSGLIFNSCNNILTEGLSRARGTTLLINILKVLAADNSLRLNEIASKIFRSSPVTKNLISRLISVDLVIKEDNVFKISDPVLRYWLDKTTNMIEFDYSVDETMLKELSENLEEEF